MSFEYFLVFCTGMVTWGIVVILYDALKRPFWRVWYRLEGDLRSWWWRSPMADKSRWCTPKKLGKDGFLSFDGYVLYAPAWAIRVTTDASRGLYSVDLPAFDEDVKITVVYGDFTRQGFWRLRKVMLCAYCDDPVEPQYWKDDKCREYDAALEAMRPERVVSSS